MSRIATVIAICALVVSARSLTSAMHERNHLATATLGFGFVLLSAYLGGRALEKLRLPRVTGYLLAGIVFGPYALNLVNDSMLQTLRLVDGVAIALIALTAGGELSFRTIKPLLRTVHAMVLLGVIGTATWMALALYAMRPWLPFLSELASGEAAAVATVLGIALASQSPAVVIALLTETKSDGPLSQTTLAMVILSDLVVIILYAIASPIAGSFLGSSPDVGTVAAGVAWELIGSVLAGIAVGALLSVYLRKVRLGPALFTLLICLVVAEVSPHVHLDTLIVCLSAGVFLENVTETEASKLIHDLERASLPVFVIFFAVAGAVLDLRLLAEVLIPATVICILRAVGFWIGCSSAGKITSAPKEVTRWTWVGLLPQAGLAVALALVFQRSFANLGAEASALVLGVVGINQLVTPVFARAALVRSGEAGKRALPDFGHASIPPKPASPPVKM